MSPARSLDQPPTAKAIYQLLLLCVAFLNAPFARCPEVRVRGYQTILWTNQKLDLFSSVQRLFNAAGAEPTEIITLLQAIFYLKATTVTREQARLLCNNLDALQSEQPQLQSFLQRLVVNVEYRSGLSNRFDLLRRRLDSDELHDTGTDQLIGALVKIWDGDNNCSAPWTDLILLNLAIVGGETDTAAFHVWDKLESTLDIQGLETAVNRYREAFVDFERLGALGGMAAVRLRQGCVNHLEALERRPNRDSKLHDAMRRLCEAEDLYSRCQDVRSVRFVQAHKILVGIQQGTESGNIVREIGEWGWTTGEHEFTNCIGLMFLRYGWREWRTRSLATTANKAYTAACQLFEAVHADMSYILGVSSISALLFDTGSFSEAAQQQNAAQAMLELVMNQPISDQRVFRQSLINSPDDEKRFQQLKFDLKRRSIPIYNSLKDPEKVKEIASELEDIPIKDPQYGALKDWYKVWANYLARKLRFQEALRGGDAAEATNIASECLHWLRSHEHSENVQVNLLIVNFLSERRCYTEAREQLDKMERLGQLGDHGINSGFSAQSASANQYTAITKHRVAYNICILAKDFKRAQKFYDTLSAADPSYFDLTRPNLDPRRWQPFTQLALMFEGLAKEALQGQHNTSTQGLDHLKTSLEYFRTSCALVEAHRNEIEDPELRANSFGLLDVSVCFSSAARVCMRLSALNAPTDDGSWATQALSFIERGKARSLLDALSSWDQNFPPHLNQNVQAIRKVLSRGVAEPSSVTTQTGKEFDEQLRRLQKTLSDSTLVIVISLSDEGIAMFTLCKNGLGPALWVEVDSARVVQSVESFLHYIEIVPNKPRTQASRERLREAVETLSSLIISPLVAELEHKESIIFIPSGCLFRFPLSALELHGEPIFMQDKSVTVCPSLAALEIIFTRSDRSTSYDNLGSTVIVGSGSLSLAASGLWSATPYTIVEANYLAARLETEPKVAENLQSAERNMILENSQILHLAAHGTFERQSPLLASIGFKEPIRVMDFGNLKLHADLVVFRACVSGLGRYTDTDDMTGFAHMLLKSGANAFIGSLWNTSDRFNALLMVGFYKALGNKTSPTSVAKALAVAQKELYTMDSEKLEMLVDRLLDDYEDPEKVKRMIRPNFNCENYIEGLELEDCNNRYKDPCFWAPFVVMGNGEVSHS